MRPLNDFVLDDGYRLGLGAFETISVKNGKGILLPYHLERLLNALDTLEIPMPLSLEEDIAYHISRMPVNEDVLRISVSQNNTVWETRKNAYTNEHYTQGFSLIFSSTRRNETSPLTGIKSLNQGDNFLQRRLALRSGYDEAVFLNSKGELTEGTVSNLFFISNKQLYTPAANCGLLAGTVRRWLLENYDVKEIHILPNDLESFQEMFISNALLGIMPVFRLGTHNFPERTVTYELLDLYRKMTEGSSGKF
ncbi:branched-chain amino acid aminotransferase/4-amino-4-deoxychorismate lyase [Desulfosporosinus acidiphilus SJ4]|uniref:Branched-chain amino acid aminotransferase/4-amino-4-deoxychorismate lyase n=1 Tax=Desulfosporosinus acidiphilus (strain DSM 22704 / JCM 16185 / SJ4) TaxID=646529 RepID=I4D0N1_DESAJ|nr:aminotransferase class IV [Desulfosporosinus acidiphilus]AFM39355.1 branched-chain amino acid aminotransferase/4-amino-4-deoxychorismate lyase [Desulfosporosinus acidiphilus SJ4]